MTIDDLERDYSPEQINYYFCHLILDDEELNPDSKPMSEEAKKNLEAHEARKKEFEAKMDQIERENDLMELDDAE